MALFAYLQMAIFHPLDLLMRGRIRQQYYSSTTLAKTPAGQDDDAGGDGGEVEVEPLQEGPGGAAESDDPAAKRHLVVLVNGLFGSVDNWDVVVECLQERLGPEAKQELLIAASRANSRRQTYEGIDRCGRRLVREIEALKQAYPNLQRISFIGHSMGGLIARHAAGHLYEPRTGLVAGLQPTHFIAMAAPHLGCEASASPAQVPFIHWFGKMPRVQGVVMSAAPVVTPYLFGRAGRQFFLGDIEDEAEPLIVRMSRDVEGEAPYLSALAAFASRTAYANSGGDHLVGWANASLRHLAQLPAVPDAPGRGVFREDPPTAGMAPAVRSALDPATLERLQHSSPSDSLSGGRDSSKSSEYVSISMPAAGSRDSWHTAASDGGGDDADSGGRGIAISGGRGDGPAANESVQRPAAAAAAASPKEGAARPTLTLTQAGSSPGRQASWPARQASGNSAEPEWAASGCLGSGEAGVAAAAAAGNSDSSEPASEVLSAEVEGMLRRLAALPWCRVDVSFTGTRMPYTAHNLIQVTRRWINFEGVAVARHLAEHVATLDTVDRSARV